MTRRCACGCGELLRPEQLSTAIYVNRAHKERARQRRRHRSAEYNRARYEKRIDYYREYERTRRRSTREAA